MNGERLSELRRDRGMTQKELGEILSVSKYTISSYENGKTSPDDENKKLLAKTFGVSLDYLMGLIDEPFPYEREKRVNCILLPVGFTAVQLDRLYEYIEFLRYGNQQGE